MGGGADAVAMAVFFGVCRNLLVDVPRHRASGDSTVPIALEPAHAHRFTSLVGGTCCLRLRCGWSLEGFETCALARQSPLVGESEGECAGQTAARLTGESRPFSAGRREGDHGPGGKHGRRGRTLYGWSPSR
mmetsp:Transcript_38926/g.95777  ORF Transcript_38926/g.95777 Transcript_38926/m.95777 type:complete len:132 (-) Transcript_38926:53-448(-)